MSSEWVKKEYNAAHALNLPIIPLLLRTAELPVLLAPMNYVDFRDEAMFDAGMEKLLAALRPLRPLRESPHF